MAVSLDTDAHILSCSRSLPNHHTHFASLAGYHAIQFHGGPSGTAYHPVLPTRPETVEKLEPIEPIGRLSCGLGYHIYIQRA